MVDQVVADQVERLRLMLSRPGTVLLDTVASHEGDQRTLLFSHPVEELVARSLDDVPHVLEGLDTLSRRGLWLAGFLTYEAGYGLEETFRREPIDEREPLAWFGAYQRPQVLAADTWDKSIALATRISLTAPSCTLGRPSYREAIERIRAHIREGDVYQINFTFPLTFGISGDVFDFYLALRQAQPVPYAAYVTLEDRTYLSLSPELFFRRQARRIVAQPMKGTAPASVDEDADRLTSEKLRADPKNRAENLMIVDLLRNDLSVCCVPGTVRVPDLFGIHRYPSVIQMTSTIEGDLRDEVGYSNIFRALFPCGSVTGAPKIRAMEIIRSLESTRRGLYCGALGFISPDETAAFNVAIRTLEIRDGVARFGTGSGIVWDSDPESEYDECLLKAKFVSRAIGDAR